MNYLKNISRISKPFYRGAKVLLSYLLALIIVIAITNCAQETAVPVVANFSLTVVENDYSVPVSIQISNTTVGAESYQWTFRGANRTSSTDRNPGTLVYNTPGSYSIQLKASNTDGSEERKTYDFSLDTPVEIGFETEIQINNFAPATIDISNSTKGATSFQWTFEGGNPANSDKEQPESVVFSEPGEHRIKLLVGNGRETHDFEKIVTIGPNLVADFDWEVAFQDDDLQIPVTMNLQNKSEGALTYTWLFTGGEPDTSTEENPSLVFNEAGTHTLSLTASNGKDTQSISKSVELFENTNLRTISNVQLGINTAHNSDSIGAFFSINTRETYTKSEITSIDGSIIDLVFFGLGTDFSFNKFVSPDALENTSFDSLANASNTVFINSQELCACSASLSVSEFDMMLTDQVLNSLVIEETPGGIQDFSDAIVPRIVLFKTADGRKGAIKIKEYVTNGQNSYISIDLKVQKENR